MFGRAIDQTVRVDRRRGGGIVPIIIEKCIEFIRNYGKLTDTLTGNCCQFT